MHELIKMVRIDAGILLVSSRDVEFIDKITILHDGSGKLNYSEFSSLAKSILIYSRFHYSDEFTVHNLNVI